ncbi:MAG TPA: glycosyltransferase family 87 protein [Blastocatellia bacterium]|nr:glycosyltransferase family 87 protein [Blastocatellia bacterium]
MRKTELDVIDASKWVLTLPLSRRLALAILAFVILVAGFYFAGKSGSNPLAYRNDFNVFYHAAREVLAGRDPYQSSLGDWTPYLYPPLLAVALVPLALLPLPVAAYAWFLINAVSSLATAIMSGDLARAGEQLSDRTNEAKETSGGLITHDVFLIAALSLFVVARFVLDNFSLGQVNPLVGGLAAGHVYLHSRNKKTASAFVLSLAVSIKLTPLVLIPYHIARRRWKFAAACLAMSVALTAMSFLPLGSRAPEAFQVFVNRTIKNEQGYDLADAGNQSLRGAIARLTTPSSGTLDQGATIPTRQPADTLTLLVSILLLLVAMLGANRARTELLAAAPFVCCLVLLSPLSWKAHFVVLILPVACLVAEAVHSGGSRRATVTSVLALIFALFNLTSPRVIGLQAAEWADAHSLVFFGALLIFAASVWMASFPPKV